MLKVMKYVAWVIILVFVLAMFVCNLLIMLVVQPLFVEYYVFARPQELANAPSVGCKHVHQELGRRNLDNGQ